MPSLGQVKYLPVSYASPQVDLETAPAVPASMKGDANADALIRECTATAPDSPRVAALPVLAAAAASALISFAFNYFSGLIGTALQTEVEKYKQTYKAETTGYFYYLGGPFSADGGTISAANGTLSAAIRCFRYSRLVDGKKLDTADAKDPQNLAVDIVGQIRIDPSGQFVQIRPLRAYYAQSKVPGGEKVTLGFGLSASSIWREGLGGKTAPVFDTVVMTEKFSFAAVRPNSAPMYYFSSDSFDWAKRPRLPLPTVSSDRNGNAVAVMSTAQVTDPARQRAANLAGNVTLTATVSEVGTPPGWLTTLQAFWKSQGDTLTKAAAAAVQTQLDLTPSSSSSSSSGGSGKSQ